MKSRRGAREEREEQKRSNKQIKKEQQKRKVTIGKRVLPSFVQLQVRYMNLVMYRQMNTPTPLIPIRNELCSSMAARSSNGARFFIRLGSSTRTRNQ